MSGYKYLVVVFLREDFAEVHRGDTDTPLEDITNFKITSKRFAVDKQEVRKILKEIDTENKMRRRHRKLIGQDPLLSKSYKGKMYANNFGKLHYSIVRIVDKEVVTENFRTEKTSKAIAQRTRRRLKSGQL